MKFFISVAAFLCAFCLVGCKTHNPELSIQVLRTTELPGLPSGSGLAISGDSAYVIGDDAPFLYKIAVKEHTYRSIPLAGHDQALARIPKPVKPDYESLVLAEYQGRDVLMAFGSGSLSPFRDSMLVIDRHTGLVQNKISVSTFYTALKKVAGFTDAGLNIEGALFSNGSLLLFNRGKNGLFTTSLDSFYNYLMNSSGDYTAPVAYREYQLPALNGIPSGFSGATALPDGNILFSASVENVQDAIGDGEVFGSYIGIIKPNKPGIFAIELLKDNGGNILKQKLESIDLLAGEGGGTYKVLAVADNDDGRSTLFELYIR